MRPVSSASSASEMQTTVSSESRLKQKLEIAKFNLDVRSG